MRTLSTSAATRTGRRRSANQDRHLATGRRLVVADGMGGRSGGEVAAALAIDVLRATPPAWSGDDLVNAVWSANAAVADAAAADAALASMGTTLVAVELLGRDRATVAWVGDSRAYRLRRGRLERLTHDHTWEASLLAAGVEASAARRSRHILTRALGPHAVVEVDTCAVDLRPGDRLLLCTDGVTGVLDDRDLADLVASGPAAGAAARVVAAAGVAGATDDATAVVGELVGGPTAAEVLVATGRFPTLTEPLPSLSRALEGTSVPSSPDATP